MKQAYKEIAMHAATRKLIDFINVMIADYQSQGFTLSVRQLYYQLVARGKIENTEKSYKRIASVINDGRLCGLIDWDAIEDRNRDIERRNHWQTGRQLLQASAEQFYMDHWDNQAQRVFVIVEKAALSGVLGGVCRENDVPLLAARGYPSVTVVREMALDYLGDAINCGQNVTILHLGDHDPSGIDMTRDLEERFNLFLGEDSGQLELIRVALTRAQVDEVNPPPNPAKTTDSRFAQYLREHGSQSWELDALEPSYLVNLVTGFIDDRRDPDAWAEKAEEIATIRKKLLKTAKNFKS